MQDYGINEHLLGEILREDIHSKNTEEGEILKEGIIFRDIIKETLEILEIFQKI